jgi:hypothetical protein
VTNRSIHQNPHDNSKVRFRKSISAPGVAVLVIFGSGAFFEASADSVVGALPSSVSVEKACSNAMGLSRETIAFDACVSSLTGSLRARIADQQAAMARRACRMDESDRVKTAECLLRADEQALDSGSDTEIAGLARKSVQQRADACVSLGIAPGTNTFQPCINDLRAALSPDRLRMGN